MVNEIKGRELVFERPKSAPACSTAAKVAGALGGRDGVGDRCRVGVAGADDSAAGFCDQIWRGCALGADGFLRGWVFVPAGFNAPGGIDCDLYLLRRRVFAVIPCAVD